MEGKPFSLQAPEHIAKEYGGNKKRIEEGMKLGLVDPTAGILAAMFIDRMRSAQMQEMQPSSTVAQQVMGGAPAAPVGPPAAGGLGALPPPAPSMTPPMGASGAPPIPPGMADGGYLPPYASGGLGDLPVPDTMFDESTNGGYDDGYAGGGIVAFATGSPGQPKVDPLVDRRLRYTNDFIRQLGDMYPSVYDPKNEGVAEYMASLKEAPEEAARQREQDKGTFLMQLGARIASETGGLVPAIGKSIIPALEGYVESQKERRKERREALRDRVEMELREQGNKGDRLKTGIALAMSTIDEDLKRQEMEARERQAAAQLRMEGGRLGLQQQQFEYLKGKKDVDERVFDLLTSSDSAKQALGEKYLAARYGASRSAGGIDLNGDGIPDNLGVNPQTAPRPVGRVVNAVPIRQG